MLKFFLAIALLLFQVVTMAAPAQPLAADPVLEKRVQTLTEELRCLVCQNQTLADSHAELAIDLKNQVRQKLASGMSDQAVIDYMVQRYGDFVLYRPRLFAQTWLLWFGPLLLLVAGLMTLASKLTRPREPQEISEQDHLRAAQLLYADQSVLKEDV